MGGEVLPKRLLISDGNTCSFRCVRLRGWSKNCSASSNVLLIPNNLHYEQFRGMQALDKDYILKLLMPAQLVSVEEYKTSIDKMHLLLDVRQPTEFEICKLPNLEKLYLMAVLLNVLTKTFKMKLYQFSYYDVVMTHKYCINLKLQVGKNFISKEGEAFVGATARAATSLGGQRVKNEKKKTKLERIKQAPENRIRPKQG
ncbi:hypothetical protein GQX74_009408 [Glossina fuscipes]|nr:hypothetical protein GQX74_009408 [Glossina fuscipes]